MLSPDLRHRYCWQIRKRASEMGRITAVSVTLQFSYLGSVRAFLVCFSHLFFFFFPPMTGKQLFPAHRRLSRLFLQFQEKSLACGLKTGSQLLNGVLLLIWYQEPWVPDQTLDSSPKNEEVGVVETPNSKTSWF